ncbi:MAG: vWA domain-containing protein [bacterium]
MKPERPRRLLFPWLAILCIPLAVVLLLAALPRAPQAAQAQDAQTPDAACDGGPTIDGITLDECVVNDFTLGGDDVSITVWYTKNAVTATREMDDDTTLTMRHWINNDSEAQDVADWAQESWEVYYEIFDRHPYTNGCGGNIDIRLEDLASGAGVAYWASSGSCRIGIDSPVVRAGNAQRTTYHEVQHYLQYAYDDGCYDDIRSNYDDNAEFVEGYADLSEDSVNTTVDANATGGTVAGYDPTQSLYDEGYMNVFTKYFVEHAGQMWTTADPQHGWDAVEAHYAECDDQDTLYVLDTVIPALTSETKESFFLNFFAANWAKDWADHDSQPELVYYDDDGNWYGEITLQEDVTISAGASWDSESTPDSWAGQYYQVTPEPVCEYVTVEVDGEAGAHLGINLMAADTSAVPSVSRAAWIGEDFTRTFAAAGVHQRIVAAVNAFDDTYDYDVSFTCVTPTVELLEPKPRPNSALVGDPDSPIAVLARFKVTDGGSPVRGLPQHSFTANAEGDALTFVPNTFQEVGEEYWAVMTPPTKDPGTTYTDMEVCLDGATCDTNDDALLYVPPGNSDLAMVFDGSGSMADEDIAGEGTRLENAKKAGTVMADLLQDGDRALVTDFSAHSCSGDDCTLDIRLHLDRSTIPGDASIADVRDAIDDVTARNRTPIGAALVDAKDRLLAAPAGENPKHIVLLSDGEENVNPHYEDVRGELMDSGVIVNTVGFSGDADEPLLSQIAGDTGGTYRFVPTTPGDGGSALQAGSPEQVNAVDELTTMGLTPQQAESIAATSSYLPGPLRLDEVYDHLETEAQGASRILNSVNSTLSLGNWYTDTANVDDSANTLRLVIAGKEPDFGFGCGSLYRVTEVQTPTMYEQGLKNWIRINPAEQVPSEWDVRNSLYDDVAIIDQPEAGTWRVRTQYNYGLCAPEEEPTAPQGTASDYPVMINASVQSDYHLQGHFLPPFNSSNHAEAGVPASVVGTLLDRNGAMPGATVIALIDRPDGGLGVMLAADDGEHGDGAANDGIYGLTYPSTDVGGTYTVRLFAFFEDPGDPGQTIRRDWIGSFWIDGPEPDDPDRNDQDQDGLPDPWEERCDLDVGTDDSQQDNDDDGLINIEEWQYGTLPCDPDTDNGGERDGSEVAGGRDPLDPTDDIVPPLGFVDVRGLDSAIRVYWTQPLSYTNMVAVVNSGGQVVDTVDMGQDSPHIIGDLTNGQMYTVTVYGENGAATGDPRGPFTVTPKADSVRPQGSVLINHDAPETAFRWVHLSLDALDEVVDGPYNAYLTPPEEQFAPQHGEVPHTSSVAEMRVTNDLSTFADPDAGWQAYSREIENWYLSNCLEDMCVVYAQFRDDAGNVSVTVSDEIRLTGEEVTLPLILAP